MKTLDIFDVAILGRGVVGNLTALTAAKAGLKTLLIGPKVIFRKKNNSPSRSYALAPSSIELINSLGIKKPIDSNMQDICSMEIVNGIGKITLDAKEAKKRYLAKIINHDYLMEHLYVDQKIPNIYIIESSPDTLEYFEVGEEEYVKLNFIENQKLYNCKSRLLIGTDGVNSWARQKAGILWGVKNYNQMAIVADISSEKKHESIACQWFNQKEILALLPTVEGRFSMVLSLPIAIGQKLMAEKKDVFNDYLNTITKKRFGNLKLASDLSFVNLSLSTVDSYVGKRIALVGDSAHTIHPLAGLGLNLGIYDLMSLFNHCDWFCDDKVNFDPGDKKKLKDYNSDRLKKVLLVQHSLDFLVDFFGSSGKYVSSFRGFGLNFVDKIPIVKKNLILRARSTF